PATDAARVERLDGVPDLRPEHREVERRTTRRENGRSVVGPRREQIKQCGRFGHARVPATDRELEEARLRFRRPRRSAARRGQGPVGTRRYARTTRARRGDRAADGRSLDASRDGDRPRAPVDAGVGQGIADAERAVAGELPGSDGVVVEGELDSSPRVDPGRDSGVDGLAGDKCGDAHAGVARIVAGERGEVDLGAGAAARSTGTSGTAAARTGTIAAAAGDEGKDQEKGQ